MTTALLSHQSWRLLCQRKVPRHRNRNAASDDDNSHQAHHRVVPHQLSLEWPPRIVKYVSLKPFRNPSKMKPPRNLPRTHHKADAEHNARDKDQALPKPRVNNRLMKLREKLKRHSEPVLMLDGPFMSQRLRSDALIRQLQHYARHYLSHFERSKSFPRVSHSPASHHFDQLTCESAPSGTWRSTPTQLWTRGLALQPGLYFGVTNELTLSI